MLTFLFFLLFRVGFVQAECLFMVDAGHGGKDLGTSTLQIQEKDLTLSYARQLVDILRRQFTQDQVLLTRDRDEFSSLEERRERVKHSGCSHLLSLHFNGSLDRNRWGTEIYFGSPAPSEWKNQLAVSDYFEILTEFKRKRSYQDSAKWAMRLRHRLLKTFPDRPIRLGQMPLVILQQPNVKGILIEIGYLSHPQDSSAIQETQFRELFLQTLAQDLKVGAGKDLPRK